MQAEYVIAVDSGGTFTDCVAIANDGSVTRAKAPSTPVNFSIGVMESVKRVAEDLGLDLTDLLSRCTLFAHGTTVATNALLTRRGSRTGYLTTKGHEDAIIIGRTYQKVAGLTEGEICDVANLNKADPIVPRSLIHGIEERVDKSGSVLVKINPESVKRAMTALAAQKVESIAVCLLWSFLNADHEKAVRELILQEHPDIAISISSEVAPVIKEYERGAATVINAYLTKNVAQYLTELENALRESGFRASPVVMQSSGGVISIDQAKSKPVRLLTSGPAGGVIGAQFLGKILGYANIVTTDVGGTSFDVGLVVNGEAQFTNIATFDQYEVALPVIDVATIGAGGGSIAWIERETGVLRVGPQSAGAEPGPACYNLGGTSATVTDANVVLGRINPDYFLGGRRKLDGNKSWHAVTAIAKALSIGVPEAASGIIDIADEHMADLVRRVTLERGYDPRDFVLFAFGGAGPMHACAYGREAGCSAIVMPTLASEFSAFGIAGSDVMVVEELSNPRRAPFDPDELDSFYRKLESLAAERLRENGTPNDRIRFQRYVRLRYKGQVHEVETPVPSGTLGRAQIEAMISKFERIYEAKYGQGTAYKHVTLSAMTYRVHGFGRINLPALVKGKSTKASARGAIKEHRPVYFSTNRDFVDAPIYGAERLRPGHKFSGPAIVESVDTTAVIHPGQTVTIDSYSNIVVTP